MQTRADLELLITLDDPWNAQECDTFNNHQAEHTATHPPGQTYSARGQDDNRADSLGRPETLSSTTH